MQEVESKTHLWVGDVVWVSSAASCSNAQGRAKSESVFLFIFLVKIIKKNKKFEVIYIVETRKRVSRPLEVHDGKVCWRDK